MNLIELSKNAVEDVVNKENDARCKEAIYISDANKCARQVYYSLDFKKPLERTEALSGLRMDAGKRIEESLIRYWKDSGMDVQEQVRIDREFYKDLRIHGNADAVICHEGVEYVVEIKSFYGYYQAKEIREGRPNPNYVAQLALYMHYLDIPRGILFYVDRSDMSMFQFTVELGSSEEIYVNGEPINKYVGSFIDKLATVAVSLEKEEAPLPDYDYKWDLNRFEEEAKTWSKSKIDSELKVFMPIERVMSEPDEKGKRKVLGYSLGDILFKTKDDAEAEHMNRVLNGEIPYISAVHGDYQCKYCDYKAHCLESREINLGYTQDEFIDRLETLKNIRVFL